MPELRQILAKLQRHHGAPPLPPAKGPFELVMWENACYLLPDERRAQVFEALRAPARPQRRRPCGKPRRNVLLPLARLGGMRPETRVFRWREIARITREQFAGDLDQILTWDYAKARKALQQFPNIGQPGAEKILMYCGSAPGLPLEWNGVRVLARIGYGRVAPQELRSNVQERTRCRSGPNSRGARTSIASAHLLLRTHGKTLCRDARPLCAECPVCPMCAFATSGPRIAT